MPDTQLSDDDRAFIQREIRAGDDATADEVVSAGLQAVRADEDESRLLIQKGEDDIKPGRVHTFDTADDLTDHILAKVRRNARTAVDPFQASTHRSREHL